MKLYLEIGLSKLIVVVSANESEVIISASASVSTSEIDFYDENNLNNCRY